MRRIVVLAAAVFAVSEAGAGAQSAPTWNGGYANGWWPGGFGYPPVTVQAPAYPCSVTAYGPTFHSYTREWRQDYGAGTSCAQGVGIKTLTVSDQVLGPDQHTWYTITGSTVTYGPWSISPARIIRNRPAYLGRVYRTVATAKLVVPNGHAGCSISNTCNQTMVNRAQRGTSPVNPGSALGRNSAIWSLFQSVHGVRGLPSPNRITRKQSRGEPRRTASASSGLSRGGRWRDSETPK